MRSLLDVVGRLSPSPAGTRPRHFSLIDLGSDTVKAVVVRSEKTGARVLGFGFAPMEGRGLQGGRANVAALASITDGALVAAEDQTNLADRGKVV